MGKYSNFDRNPRDFYPTPYACVLPLLPFLNAGDSFYEPCAGDGVLIEHLSKNGLACVGASDIAEYSSGNMTIKEFNALNLTSENIGVDCDYIITNPPWSREVLHPMIETFRAIKPTWLLFDADWMHTIQSQPYMEYCQKIVSIGRVKWIAGSKSVGKENACWYLFDKEKNKNFVEFYGR